MLQHRQRRVYFSSNVNTKLLLRKQANDTAQDLNW